MFVCIKSFWFLYKFVVYVLFLRFIFFSFVYKGLGIWYFWLRIYWLESRFYELMCVLYKNFSVPLIFLFLKRTIFYFKRVKLFFYYFYYLRQVIYVLYFLLIILLQLFPFSIQECWYYYINYIHLKCFFCPVLICVDLLNLM